MVQVAKQVKWQILESELEALLVEAELIRLHQPKYNVLLKDDKSNIYLHITQDKFPKVLTIRKKDVITKRPKGSILGPYQSSFKLKEVLRLVRPIFPWCNTGPNEGRKCFYNHLDLCPGVCSGDISEDEYQQNIKNLIEFMKGKKKDLLRQLEKKLQIASDEQEFEKAATYRDQIRLIREVTSKDKKLAPDITLPRLKQKRSEEQLLRLRKIVTTHLKLPNSYPINRLEGYDVSNTQGTNPAVSMVTFSDGQIDSNNYRIFNIKSLSTPNDFQMMKEALSRRQNHPEWGWPDLIIIDGGKGQLRAAISVWQDQTPIISIAKHPDRLLIPIFADQINQSKIEGYHQIKLPENDPALNLVQQVRDESHRFSQKQHKRMRTREMISSIKY